MAPSRRRSSRTSAPPAPPRRAAAAATPKLRRYELIKPIGKGKFAVVYRARRIADDELVALKKIAVDSMDHRAREKCLKEVRLLQSLHHPNIIRYLDSLIEGDELVIVFEWAAAGDLKRQIRKAVERKQGFEERVIWKYFSQICDALAHMHEQRILHRDLKPANVFLTLNGTVKVGDLGLGRMMSEHTFEAHSKAEGLNLYSLFQKISKADYEPLPDTYSAPLRDLATAMLSVDPAERPDVAYVRDVATRMRKETIDGAPPGPRGRGLPGGARGAVQAPDLARGFGPGVLDCLRWLGDAALSAATLAPPDYGALETLPDEGGDGGEVDDDDIAEDIADAGDADVVADDAAYGAVAAEPSAFAEASWGAASDEPHGRGVLAARVDADEVGIGIALQQNAQNWRQKNALAAKDDDDDGFEVDSLLTDSVS
ncbi:serine/threonine kinase [Aureococcus anophagefferens]|nr:serine/threonine kinase [Aureococcus anophagefferens]